MFEGVKRSVLLLVSFAIIKSMIIQDKYIYAYIKFLGIDFKVKINQMSCKDFESIANLLKPISPYNLYQIIFESRYELIHEFIQPRNQWLLASLNVQFKKYPLWLRKIIIIFIASNADKDFLIRKVLNEGVLLYLDRILEYEYNKKFRNENINPARNIYNAFIGEGVINAILKKNNIEISKDMSYLEYIQKTSEDTLRVLKAMNGLTVEDQKEEILYTFNCEKYIDGLMAIMQGYKIEIDNYASMFSEDTENQFKRKIGRVSWGKSKFSKQYIFCKDFN